MPKKRTRRTRLGQTEDLVYTEERGWLHLGGWICSRLTQDPPGTSGVQVDCMCNFFMFFQPFFFEEEIPHFRTHDTGRKGEKSWEFWQEDFDTCTNLKNVRTWMEWQDCVEMSLLAGKRNFWWKNRRLKKPSSESLLCQKTTPGAFKTSNRRKSPKQTPLASSVLHPPLVDVSKCIKEAFVKKHWKATKQACLHPLAQAGSAIETPTFPSWGTFMCSQRFEHVSKQEGFQDTFAIRILPDARLNVLMSLVSLVSLVGLLCLMVFVFMILKVYWRRKQMIKTPWIMNHSQPNENGIWVRNTFTTFESATYIQKLETFWNKNSSTLTAFGEWQLVRSRRSAKEMKKRIAATKDPQLEKAYRPWDDSGRGLLEGMAKALGVKEIKGTSCSQNATTRIQVAPELASSLRCLGRGLPTTGFLPGSLDEIGQGPFFWLSALLQTRLIGQTCLIPWPITRVSDDGHKKTTLQFPSVFSINSPTRCAKKGRCRIQCRVFV